MPARSRCWFAARLVDVRRAYGLTIDRRELAVLDWILASCTCTALGPVVCAAPSGSSGPATGNDAIARYDNNRNGRITRAEARRHGFAPVLRSHPAYGSCAMGTGMDWCASSCRIPVTHRLNFPEESLRPSAPTIAPSDL